MYLQNTLMKNAMTKSFLSKIIFLGILPIMLLLLQTNNSFGQGCSDAGFCSMNSFKPNKSDSSSHLTNQFKIGTFYGSADNAITVYGGYLEYSKQINNKLGFDTKLTSINQTGNGISSFGLADLFLNFNYKTANKLMFTVGGKLPLSGANSTSNNLPLPMDYQASLGTVDLILGVGYEINKLQLVAAIQQPITQNKNQFLASQYPPTSKLSSFQSTNNFQRAGDVLLRISYPFSINSKLRLTPSLLPIYHLGNDTYTDELNRERTIIGSQGLTLNGNIFLDYEINTKNIIQINFGRPFVVRDARPDGLTRGYIFNLEYKVRF